MNLGLALATVLVLGGDDQKSKAGPVAVNPRPAPITDDTILAGKPFTEWQKLLLHPNPRQIDPDQRDALLRQIGPEHLPLLLCALKERPPSLAVSQVTMIVFDQGDSAFKKAAFPHLLKMLDDDVPANTKGWAAMTIGHYGALADAAEPRLEKIAKGKDPTLAMCGDAALMGLHHDRVQRHMLKNDPSIKEFQTLYPNARYFMSYFTGQAGPTTWNSKIGLHGRYELTMQFKMTVDRKKWTATAAEPPTFYLLEVATLEGSSMTYNSASQRTFGPDRWRELVAHKGDLAALLPNVKTNSPIPGFDRTWKN